jgi:hypothetical protein
MVKIVSSKISGCSFSIDAKPFCDLNWPIPLALKRLDFVNLLQGKHLLSPFALRSIKGRIMP